QLNPAKKKFPSHLQNFSCLTPQPDCSGSFHFWNGLLIRGDLPVRTQKHVLRNEIGQTLRARQARHSSNQAWNMATFHKCVCHLPSPARKPAQTLRTASASR